MNKTMLLIGVIVALIVGIACSEVRYFFFAAGHVLAWILLAS